MRVHQQQRRGGVPRRCGETRPRDEVRLGAGEYFALGDNITNSRDSRYWGTVPERNLLGPACLVYW
ncbi:MAG TPA: S26 family signal peptidase, partial [Candidatus Hydrogenedentes bacterium]|nr:S26 family signal peptidase [Candidatus Hydrogenedentota bacterium]